MKVFIILTFVSLLSSVSFATTPPIQAPGFKNGNNISIKEISGSVTYYCRDNMGNSYTRHWSCYEADVNPGTHDYFVSHEPLAAKSLTLTSTRADGSIKTKKVGFNAEKASSISRINLLVKSLTQSPLLKEGDNTVAYQFTNEKAIVSQGAFQSKVTVLESKKCRHRNEFASQTNVCEFQSFGCDRYFYMENNCNY